MSLGADLQEILTTFSRRHGGAPGSALQIEAANCWNLRIRLDLPQFPGLCIRNLRHGDVAALTRFGAKLGPESRELFAPYPWDEPAALPVAFQKAIDQATGRIDASYLMEMAGAGPIAHFFLWKAGGNPHSWRHRLQVPELGVAVADDCQSRGLGSLAVRILEAVACDLGADAVELTTAMTNKAGWQTYQRCGFEYSGIIRIPLGVDVTAAVAGEVHASRFRDERQMVYLLKAARRQQVLDYLKLKREAAIPLT